MILESDDLAQYIISHGIQAELVHLAVETPTVTAAAEAVGVTPKQICKSLVFIAEELPVLVIASGNAPVSYKLLAQTLNVSRRKLKIAGPDEVLQVTGFRVGTVPPFGHSNPLSTFVDSGVLEQQILYAGGGSIDTLLKIESTELLRASKGASADLQGS
jgi:prolyl-tRNA editing enzyme YbaK/EbsC (Cys-tRNA(Pro) deacylase)